MLFINIFSIIYYSIYLGSAQILVPLNEKEWLVNLNRMRAAEPASDMQLLAWDSDLQDLAEEMAATCTYQETGNTFIKSQVNNEFYQKLRAINHLHENARQPLNTQLIIYDWFDQIFDYNFETESCDSTRNCNGFTTLSSASSCGVACSMSLCSEDSNSSTRSSYLTVCIFGSMENTNTSHNNPYTVGPACKLCNSCTKNKLCAGVCQKKINGMTMNERSNSSASASVDSVESKPKNCSNYHILCEFWASENECFKDEEYMLENCPGSCDNSCDEIRNEAEVICSDNYHKLCKMWHKLQLCDSPMWTQFMHFHCALTCNEKCAEVKAILHSLKSKEKSSQE